MPVALEPSISFCSKRRVGAPSAKNAPLSLKPTIRLLRIFRRFRGPASVAMPEGRDGLAALGADAASALANERRGSHSFAAQLDGAIAVAGSDATLAALLAHMRAAHRDQAVALAPSDAGDAGPADEASPSDDRIAAMLVRWRIEDPTAADRVGRG